MSLVEKKTCFMDVCPPYILIVFWFFTFSSPSFSLFPPSFTWESISLYHYGGLQCLRSSPVDKEPNGVFIRLTDVPSGDLYFPGFSGKAIKLLSIYTVSYSVGVCHESVSRGVLQIIKSLKG